MEIITNFLTQVIFTVGIIALFGVLIAVSRRGFCSLLGNAGHKTLLITGLVGTPIHELSHALMCIIFGHKINEIKLYDPYSDDGTLGYVNHSYNPKNIYHQIGNFFIGMAPIVCGSGIILLLMRILVPSIFGDVTSALGRLLALPTPFSFESFGSFFEGFWEVVISVFDFSYADDAKWWVSIVLALMICSHMELSFADIRGGVKGCLILLGGMLAVDIVLYFVYYSALTALTAAIVTASAYIVSFLAISGVFALFLLAIALLITFAEKLIYR